MKKIRHILEFFFVYILLTIVRFASFSLIRKISFVLGNGLYYLSKRRRSIALDNLKRAYQDEFNTKQIKIIAKKSCVSFVQTFLEAAKYLNFLKDPKKIVQLAKDNRQITHLFQKAKQYHDTYGGCIFVTPHLGNWELLPHVSIAVGIPLTVVARPLDNPYLHKLLYQHRLASGQLIIPKRNAMFKLQQTLQKKRSIGMLPDQSTMKGLNVIFFGRTATATPIPALLSVTYRKPIVVVACCRDEQCGGFTGFVSDPLMPEESVNEKSEVYRLTQKMTELMEQIIRQYPDQYLWIHNRWKVYK